MDSMIQLIDVPNCDAQMFEGSDVSNQPRGLTDISCSTTLNRGNRIFLSIRWHKQDSMFSQSARAFNIFNPKPAVVRTSPRASPYEREPFKSLDSRMSHRMQNGRMFLTWKPTSLDATLKTGKKLRVCQSRLGKSGMACHQADLADSRFWPKHGLTTWAAVDPNELMRFGFLPSRLGDCKVSKVEAEKAAV